MNGNNSSYPPTSRKRSRTFDGSDEDLTGDSDNATASTSKQHHHHHHHHYAPTSGDEGTPNVDSHQRRRLLPFVAPSFGEAHSRTVDHDMRDRGFENDRTLEDRHASGESSSNTIGNGGQFEFMRYTLKYEKLAREKIRIQEDAKRDQEKVDRLMIEEGIQIWKNWCLSKEYGENVTPDKIIEYVDEKILPAERASGPSMSSSWTSGLEAFVKPVLHLWKEQADGRLSSFLSKPTPTPASASIPAIGLVPSSLPAVTPPQRRDVADMAASAPQIQTTPRRQPQTLEKQKETRVPVQEAVPRPSVAPLPTPTPALIRRTSTTTTTTTTSGSVPQRPAAVTATPVPTRLPSQPRPRPANQSADALAFAAQREAQQMQARKSAPVQEKSTRMTFHSLRTSERNHSNQGSPFSTAASSPTGTRSPASIPSSPTKETGPTATTTSTTTASVTTTMSPLSVAAIGYSAQRPIDVRSNSTASSDAGRTTASAISSPGSWTAGQSEQGVSTVGSTAAASRAGNTGSTQSEVASSMGLSQVTVSNAVVGYNPVNGTMESSSSSITSKTSGDLAAQGNAPKLGVRIDPIDVEAFMVGLVQPMPLVYLSGKNRTRRPVAVMPLELIETSNAANLREPEKMTIDELWDEWTSTESRKHRHGPSHRIWKRFRALQRSMVQSLPAEALSSATGSGQKKTGRPNEPIEVSPAEQAELDAEAEKVWEVDTVPLKLYNAFMPMVMYIQRAAQRHQITRAEAVAVLEAVRRDGDFNPVTKLMLRENAKTMEERTQQRKEKEAQEQTEQEQRELLAKSLQVRSATIATTVVAGQAAPESSAEVARQAQYHFSEEQQPVPLTLAQPTTLRADSSGSSTTIHQQSPRLEGVSSEMASRVPKRRIGTRSVIASTF